jgi:hypothetical protein
MPRSAADKTNRMNCGLVVANAPAKKGATANAFLIVGAVII